MNILIDAFDTLSFGRGKPAVWGEDTYGAGMFPPFPSVILGSLRTAWFADHPTDIKVANTESDPTGSYCITNFMLKYGDVFYLPVPADSITSKEYWEDHKVFYQQLTPNNTITSLDLKYCLTEPSMFRSKKVKTTDRIWITQNAFQEYLDGKAKETKECIHLEETISEEKKIGLYRNRSTKTPRTSMLYRTSMTRPVGTKGKMSFAVSLDCSENAILPSPSGVLRLGSHGKTAKYRMDENRQNINPGNISEEGIFKLYIATPAILKNGWRPEWLDKNTLQGCPSGSMPELELLTAAVHGYESCGGFNMKERKPKPMRRAVRSGSVYYFRLLENHEENRRAIIKHFHGRSISEDEESQRNGFGLGYIGTVSEKI